LLALAIALVERWDDPFETHWSAPRQRSNRPLHPRACRSGFCYTHL